MRITSRGISEYQVRTRLYEPPHMGPRLEAKLACWRISSAPRMRGEDLRRAFEQRLDNRADVVEAPAEVVEAGRIRLGGEPEGAPRCVRRVRLKPDPPLRRRTPVPRAHGHVHPVTQHR